MKNEAETLIRELEEKYGEDFNWSVISASNKFFVEEAGKEIKNGHFLYGKRLYSIAKCDSNDDVLFITEKLQDNLYIILHLTYHTNGDTVYPKCVVFKKLDEIRGYIEKQYEDR